MANNTLEKRIHLFHEITSFFLSSFLTKNCFFLIFFSINLRFRLFPLDPLTFMSDQDRISPYYIYKKSCRQVMRIKKNINYGITS